MSVLGCSAQATDELGAEDAIESHASDSAPAASASEHSGTGRIGTDPFGTGAPSCISISSEDRPAIPRTVSHSVLWRAPSTEYHPQRVVVGEGRVYWSDVAGNLWMLLDGQSEPVLLRSLPSLSLTLVELVLDGNDLYFGEATRLGGGAVPPSRLLRVPQGADEPSVVYESVTKVIAPIGTVDDQVLIKLYTNEDADGIWQIDARTGQLHELPVNVPPHMSRVVGDHLYWLDPIARQVTGTSGLWRAHLPELDPQHLTDIRGTMFDVGPGYVLSREGAYLGGPAYFPGQRFVKLDEASRCVLRLPGISGISISPTMTVDATHAYWQQDNSAQSFSPDNPPLAPLFRTNLEDGTTEQLDTPGLVLDVFSNLSYVIGQDKDHVYLMAGPALVRVDKP